MLWLQVIYMHSYFVMNYDLSQQIIPLVFDPLSNPLPLLSLLYPHGLIPSSLPSTLSLAFRIICTNIQARRKEDYPFPADPAAQTIFVSHFPQ